MNAAQYVAIGLAKLSIALYQTKNFQIKLKIKEYKAYRSKILDITDYYVL